jgi:hypothetical protein
MASLPLSALELRDAVREARPYDVARLDRVLRLDASRGLVEVQAGTTWRSLAAHLRPDDSRAAAVRTTTPTVGESIAWNAAGPDGHPAVAHVESLTLITPDSELRRVSRLAHRELFALVAGGHCAFGALYSATLRIESLARAVAEAAPVETLTLSGGGAATRALQLLIPAEALDAFVAEARARCSEWRAAIESIEVRRTRGENETFLRWARRDYAELSLRLAEPCTLGGSVRATQLRRELIDTAIALGGSFPIACTPEATRAQTEACYPQLGEFMAHKRRLDPAGRMVNAWYRHCTSLLGREPCKVRWANQSAP